MYLLSSNSSLVVVLICIGVAIVLIGVGVFVFLKKNSKNSYLIKVDNFLKQIECENRSQIEAYITRLKNISNKNDSYSQIHNQISMQFERLMTVEKDKLLIRQKGLKERVLNEQKIRRGLIEQIKSFENAIIQYKKDIKHIQTDLENYFKDGDALRIRLTNLQAQYQQVNADIEKYSSSLSLCKNELVNYLSDIEMYFDVFDDNLSAAKYKEADKNLQSVEKLLVNVYGYIETIAQYCNMIEEIIPQQLKDLEEKTKSLDAKGYVVNHAKVPELVANIRSLLENSKNQFRHLCFGDFEEISYEIQTKLAEVHAHLDQEVMAKHELDNKYKIVNGKVANNESEFIKTKRLFATMLEYYIIPEEVHHKFATFQQNSTDLTDLKRDYDAYIYVNDKHPASFMLEKVEKIDILCNSVNDDINYFNQYFINAKEYVEKAFTTTEDLLVLLASTMGKVRYNKCKVVYNKYISSVNDSINALKSVNELLMQRPINIDILYKTFSNIVSDANELIQTINNELNNYQMFEKCIVFANPLRFQFIEVEKQLNEIETLFKNEQYQQAQEKLNYILNNYHPAAYDALKGK